VRERLQVLAQPTNRHAVQEPKTLAHAERTLRLDQLAGEPSRVRERFPRPYTREVVREPDAGRRKSCACFMRPWWGLRREFAKVGTVRGGGRYPITCENVRAAELASGGKHPHTREGRRRTLGRLGSPSASVALPVRLPINLVQSPNKAVWLSQRLIAGPDILTGIGHTSPHSPLRFKGGNYWRVSCRSG
jgi:hypothetical protein